eukprot:4328092-Pleurochrysis_carterae.AAC.2
MPPACAPATPSCGVEQEERKPPPHGGGCYLLVVKYLDHVYYECRVSLSEKSSVGKVPPGSGSAFITLSSKADYLAHLHVLALEFMHLCAVCSCVELIPRSATLSVSHYTLTWRVIVVTATASCNKGEGSAKDSGCVIVGARARLAYRHRL